MQKVINSGYSHRSVPAQELHSRAAPSVGGSITAQSVQPQGEIPEEGRKKTSTFPDRGYQCYNVQRTMRLFEMIYQTKKPSNIQSFKDCSVDVLSRAV